MFISFPKLYCAMTNRKTVKAWFALTIRNGVHSGFFLRIQWLKFQHLTVVMNQSLELIFLIFYCGSESSEFFLCVWVIKVSFAFDYKLINKTMYKFWSSKGDKGN